MLTWFVFVIVATLNLILGIVIAIWMKREIASSESRAESSDLGAFGGIAPLNLESLAQQPLGVPRGSSLSEKDAAIDLDLPDTTVSPNATSEPVEEKGSITEVFGLDPASDGQSTNLSGTPDPGIIENELLKSPDSGLAEGDLSATNVDASTDTSSATTENRSPMDESTEVPTETTEPQDEMAPIGGTLGLTQLLETCSRTISELIAVFDRMRAQAISKGEQLNAIQASITPIMEQFLEEYHQVLPKLVSTEHGGPILEETLACLQEHTLAANQSVERLTLIDHRGDLQTSVQQVFAELGRLISRTQRVRDELEAAFAQSLFSPQPGAGIDEKIQRDPLTGLWNRTGVEVFFDKKWGREHRRETLSGVLLDLDQFRQINQEYGYALGDQLLKGVANLLEEIVPRGTFLARYRGDQFLLLKPEWDSRQFVRAVEQIRQSLEVAKFHCGGQTLTVTVSCGVTESRTDDVITSFCERLDEAVYEAKRAGGNRTFVHNGEYAQSIVPHNLKVTEREVSIATAG